MVGADGVQDALLDARPEGVDIRLIAERRLADVLRPLLLVEPLPRQVQVEGARLDVDREATRLGLGARLQRPLGGEVDDVDRGAGRLGEGNGALGGHQLGDHRAALRVVAQGGPAGGHETGRGVFDQGVVLTVDQGDQPGRASASGGLQEARHRRVEPGHGHEELDAVVARGE